MLALSRYAVTVVSMVLLCGAGCSKSTTSKTAGNAAGDDGAAGDGETVSEGGQENAVSSKRAATDTLGQRQAGRLVILGFDGVDPRRVQRLVDSGELPNIKSLGETGHVGPLRTTTPPQSPVAWAAFATGSAPGEHGVFDFIRREPKTYFPAIATVEITHAQISGDRVTPASARNRRRGMAFWDVLARAGVAAGALFVPYSYPLAKDGAEAIAGLGLPDARGINSSFTLLSARRTRLEGPPPAGGQFAELHPWKTRSAGSGRSWHAEIAGPTVKKDGGRQRTWARVELTLRGKIFELTTVGPSGPTTQSLKLGQTGEYVELTFLGAEPLKIVASTRFTPRIGGKDPELYVEPLSNLPGSPYLPVASSVAFGESIWRDHGPFKTVGWVHDTSGLGASAMAEEQFIGEAMATMKKKAEISLAAFGGAQDGDGQQGDDLFISVFTATDRIAHMFYNYLDKEHPRHPRNSRETRRFRGRFDDVLDDAYRQMDVIIGKFVSRLAAADTLLVLSDHGFDSFRRGFNINAWLQKNGYLKLRPGGRLATARCFTDADWSATRAYALGTGGIFLNLRGREGQGIVAPGDAAALAREIADKLSRVRDGRTVVVKETVVGDDLFAGPARADAPDLRVSLAPGYRASWATALCGIGNTLFEDNTKKWAGDHASSHAADVPGIIFSNRRIELSDPSIEDISRTAFDHFGIAPPANNIGRELF